MNRKFLITLPWLLPTFCLVGVILSAVFAVSGNHARDMQEFGLLPVIANGRVQPLESLARNHLLAIQGKQSVSCDNAPGTPAAWLAELAFHPHVADARKIFLIHHDDLLGVTGLSGSTEKVFSFDALRPSFPALQQESARIEKIEAGARSAYETSLMRLTRNLTAYNQLKHSLALPHMTDAETQFRSFTEKVTAAMTAASGKEPPKDQALMEEASRRMREMLAWVPYTEVFVCPSPHSLEDWRKLPDAVIDSAQQAQLHPAALAYARMGDAYRACQWDQFETIVREYRLWLDAQCPRPSRKCIAETWFQRLAPFYRAMPLYIVAFVMAAVSWLRPNPAWQLAAFRVLMIGFLMHTAGLVTRMILEGRPPVTNLYSSAIFIGWGVIVLGIILERYHRNGIGTAVASLIGFATLLIAHHLSLSGDTLEMMRAVLDTNFWLATHVVIITLGYSSCFLAGFLAIAWILRRLRGNMTSATSASMRGMVYGVICFATLASFVGTVLGGIWADQSWGRFWGWDPKENGALLIVLWNAIILHARWGGMIQDRGLMIMAVFGNVVTSWSWFGTNMLGIGLHSYGFTDAAFFWLMLFVISQLLIMLLGWKTKQQP